MKNILKYVFVFLLILFLTKNDLSSKSFDEIKREVLVWINKGYIFFPEKEKNYFNLEDVKLNSSNLSKIFKQYKVESIARAFPDFTDSDSLMKDQYNNLKKDIYGNPIIIPQFSKIFIIRLSLEKDVDNFINEIIKFKECGFAEKNYSITKFFTMDPDYTKQWYLKNTGQWGGTAGADINIESAWQIFSGNSNTVIGILDAGVLLNHEDLNGHVSGDALDQQSGHSQFYHGTFVAGICGAITNNNIGISGINQNSNIYSRRVVEYTTEGIEAISVEEKANRVIQAVNHPSNILNCSWGQINANGTPQYSGTLRLAFLYAYNNWILTVCAIGNDGNTTNYQHYPAAFGPGCMAVGATDDNDARAYYSNHGNWISVVAPGGINPDPYGNQHDFWGLWGPNTNQYKYGSGTSFSAPCVTGVASLIKGYSDSHNLYLNPDDIQKIIELSADDKGSQGFDPEYGWGRLNAGNALQKLLAPNQINHYTANGAYIYQETGPYLVDVLTNNYSGSDLFAYRKEVRSTIYFPCTVNPKVWGNHYGSNCWYHDNSYLYDIGWCEVVPGSVSTNSVTLRSNYYEIKTQLGQHVGWFPIDNPANVHWSYTVMGTPMVAPQISSMTQYPNPIPRGGSGSVGCNLSQGNGDITYDWSYNYLPEGVTISYYGNHVNVFYSHSFGKENITKLKSGKNLKNNINKGPEPDYECFNLFCTAHNCAGYSNQGNICVAYNPNGNGNQGCPWVSVLDNAQNFTPDNNILHRAEFTENYGLYVTDMYKMNVQPGVFNGNIQLNIAEMNNDYDYVDQVKLLAVDHPLGTVMGITENNDIVLYDTTTIISPDQAILDSIINVTQQLQYLPGTVSSDTLKGISNDSINISYNGNKLHESIINFKNKFHKLFGPKTYTDSLAMIGFIGTNTDRPWWPPPPPPQPKVDAGYVLVTTQSDANYTKPFAIRMNPSLVIIPYATNNDQVANAQINWNVGYQIAYFSTVDVVYGGYSVNECSLIAANSSNDGDVTTKLLNKDLDYAEMDSLCVINLTFSGITSSLPGTVRDYVFQSNGQCYFNAPENKALNFIVNKPKNNVPSVFELHQNYPNPFNPVTTIKYDIPKESYVTIKIYDLTGREIATIVNEVKQPGYHSVTFNAMNYASGVYLYRIDAGNFTAVKKMVLVK